jgi:hypothetical protein
MGFAVDRADRLKADSNPRVPCWRVRAAMEPPFHVFLSHNSQDKPIVREIRRFLHERELRSWIDEEDLTPGRSWQEEIERILTSVPVVAVLVGKDGMGPWERPEMRVALSQYVKRRMPVIPVLLPGAPREPEIPPLLGELTWVDLRGGLDSRGIDRLVHGITGKKPVVATEKQILAEALDAAYLRKEELTIARADTQAVEQEILGLRREMREGGRLHAGDILDDRFKLVEPLGRGGFATVWKAYDRREEGLVAVKVLHGQFSEDRTRLDRFFRGARKMADLQHPGIVRVLEKRLDDGGYHFFVMEYVPGGDLRQAVLEKRLAPEWVVPLLCEVAAALGFAHQRGIVHRDVKPANILLDAEGRPKLTDFDLVRAFDTTGGTLGGGMLGTFLYTAPEAMSNPQEAGVATDVYSLAMTAAFCLFRAELPMEVLRDTKKFLRRVPCAAGVRAALQKGAAWKPEGRFGSVAELARALEEGRTAPAEKAPVAKAEAARHRLEIRAWRSKQLRSSGTTLVGRIEEEISKLPKAQRLTAVLQAIEAALPIPPEDLKTLGIAAWGLDYFRGLRRSRAGREKARSLRERLLAPLRERYSPPRLRPSEWAAMPGDDFLMGSPAEVGYRDEQPVHNVTISPFWMATRQVTNREYRQLVPDQKGADELPVVNVSWYAAYAYAAWLGGRLPTEAEWEYAARGRSPHEYNARDGSPSTLERVGWYVGNSDGRLHPVGELEPNPWGLYDMYGNIWEWVADWKGPYGNESQVDPWGFPRGGGGRVARGGCFRNDFGWVRAAYRVAWAPLVVSEILGFRVVLPAGPELIDGRP